MPIVTSILGAIVSAFIFSFIGGVLLRAAIAGFKIQRQVSLGDAARTVFYPLIGGSVASLVVSYGLTAALGKQPWIMFTALGLQALVFLFWLKGSIEDDLNLKPNQALPLLAVTGGAMLLLMGGLAIALQLI